MEADPASAVAYGHDTTIGATICGLVGFGMDNQAGGGLIDEGDMHAGDTQKSIGTFTPPPAGAGSKVGQVRVSFEIGSLVATNSKRP